MASSPAITDIASAVHAAALAEAAARSQRDSATRAATEDAPTTADDRPTGAKAEAEELTAIYEDEKSRNDAIQANYHNVSRFSNESLEEDGGMLTPKAEDGATGRARRRRQPEGSRTKG